MSTESRSDLLRLLRLFSCNNKMVATAHFDRFAWFFIVYRTILKFPTTVVDLYSYSYSSVIFVLIILKYKDSTLYTTLWMSCLWLSFYNSLLFLSLLCSIHANTDTYASLFYVQILALSVFCNNQRIWRLCSRTKIL